MKEGVRKLWELCFDDTKEFIDLYFEKRFKDDLNLAVIEDGRVISALQMIPYTFTYYGSRFDISYISGASTHPGYRSGGVMRKLLGQAHHVMYEKEVLISTLIPAQDWLFGYYENNGYTPAFYYSAIQICADDLENSPELPVDEAFAGEEDVYSYFNRKMSERNCCIQHTEEDFLTVLSDLHISRGKLFAARRQEQIAGLLFCIPSQDILYVTEFLTDSVSVLHSMLKEVSAKMGLSKIELNRFSTRAEKPKGMARIINAGSVMELYARQHPGEFHCIELTDKNLSQNNGIYIIEDGTSRRVTSLHGKFPVSMDIGQLTRFFLKEESACMSLMLD